MNESNSRFGFFTRLVFFCFLVRTKYVSVCMRETERLCVYVLVRVRVRGVANDGLFDSIFGFGQKGF